MKNYIGIDLGTTNSAICVYDGENTKIFKSPAQHDVTPSAIYFDKRGNKYIGTKAYEQAARSPDSAATLFKRYMGTSTKIKLPAVNLELTPEECSSEILKTLYDEPESVFSVKEVQNRFSVANYTARTDLNSLVNMGYMEMISVNKVKQNYIRSLNFSTLIQKPNL